MLLKTIDTLKYLIEYEQKECQDDGFELIKLKDGKNPAIVCIDGFMSQEDLNVSSIWTDNLSKHFSNNAVYYAKWKSKSVTSLAKSIWEKSNFKDDFLQIALNTIKFTLSDTISYWDESNKKAHKVGVLLANELKQKDETYILIGHSLGAKVIYSCIEQLSPYNKTHIQSIHLLGGAIDKSKDWQKISKAVTNKIYNYYKKDDKVLKYLYKIGQLKQMSLEEPIGINEIHGSKKIRNVNVGDIVSNHMGYKGGLKRIFDRI